MDFPIVLVKNLPYNPNTTSLYSLFGKIGTINQIRVPGEKSTNLGTCFVIYTDVQSAKKAVSELNGVNFEGRYIVVSLYQVDKSKLVEEDLEARKVNMEKMKEEYGIE